MWNGRNPVHLEFRWRRQGTLVLRAGQEGAAANHRHYREGLPQPSQSGSRSAKMESSAHTLEIDARWPVGG